MFWNARIYSGVYCAIDNGTKVGGVCEGIRDGLVLLRVEEILVRYGVIGCGMCLL